jgi:excisionase family DNA binding protein
MEEFVRPREVANMLGVTITSIYNWERTGMMPKALRPGGKIYLFRKADIDKWIEDLSRSAA